ncbi:hypothetical protein EHI8A_034090 [Entamoeba histolytica HM-1:IMSS-B]|uniref:Uncharacterized protein n=6 Tax=Entamoeba histolytica TaxID=5759 RepID=C4M0L8_ENTH1|nr:hypothetical protein EHI_008420 [Entamoeba histolytica HM-1:IMSS]EMD43768.1 Hypothetical protein EHI5A_057560 [Entamoeba histolytica KU27]EMH72212.1 hypothetical protein EHI8A_034090 [Entamoeba histolytica HM-1:IMSS-B]EMS17459.1 hypothetical protein KM1_067110 [Entamoeba histolytica HM-3:IMSS]ENY63697.1 hypothetical protein EHI7A_035550 [Entamoeba histolytica HM-1:IMSS-A]GAT94712.1 hypothetical protein CL6EHI_008420 [Entamoeba histolytica]|eukprot:XP_652563.1 hypothetical protein EHI_008420 [Entamoeba histolytica HM-1:IMSS]
MSSALRNTKNGTEAKRISVSFEAEQETTLMALLTQYGIKFIIQSPRKSSDTCQFMDIKEVIIDEEIYNFAEYIEHLIYTSGKTVDESKSHYTKYNKRNHTAATNNSLICMLEQLGWKIVLKNTKNSSVTLKMSRISVLSLGAIVISGEDIARIGGLLNKELKSVVRGHKRDTSLMISNVELPLSSFINNFKLPNEFSLKPLHRMMQPISISSHIGSTNDVICPECIVRPSYVSEVRKDDEDDETRVITIEPIKTEQSEYKKLNELNTHNEFLEATFNAQTSSQYDNELPPMPINEEQQFINYYNSQNGSCDLISNFTYYNNYIESNPNYYFILTTVETPVVENNENFFWSNCNDNGFIQSSAYNPSV